ASVGVLWKILAYFAGASLFVFGSGLAIVPFLYGGVVQQFHWLTERQFIDAVAVSMITPGPVVITVAFIGYLVAGLAGATLPAIVGISLLARMGAAQDESAGGSRASSATIRAIAIRALVTLDGRLDEPFWTTADSIDDFRQREPLEGASATERTVVKLAHDVE